MNGEREDALRFLRLAERDARAFGVLLERAAADDFPVAAFHAQQAIEKALKAALSLRKVPFARIHDLIELAGRARDVGIDVPLADDVLQRLTPYTVEFRYDHRTLSLIGPEAARQAVATCLDWIRHYLDAAQ